MEIERKNLQELSNGKVQVKVQTQKNTDSLALCERQKLANIQPISPYLACNVQAKLLFKVNLLSVNFSALNQAT